MIQADPRWARIPARPIVWAGVRETRELLPDALTFEQYLRTTTRDTTRW